VHAIFHVWRNLLRRAGKKASHLFTIERKPRQCAEYAANRVFAIDFDEKAVRVARTLNLIAGDGQSNVLHLNALDYPAWAQRAKDNDWRDIYAEGFRKLRRLCGAKDEFREFQFDALMANPPFAGDIRESKIIHLFELGKKMQRRRVDYGGGAKRPTAEKGWHEKISRHILFIERNLQFLRPGGRMAIVLPQGVFNNVTDYYARAFIAAHCRILAVVGLHPNTFKPHTGTKTSVLFAQKWNDDKSAGPLCPRRDDYPIFFATMRKPGKDNSGDKIYAKRGGELLRDANGHFIVEHDLFNLYAHHFPDDKDRGGGDLDAPGIADAFWEFAKKEELSFAKKT
jgi:type I restriction enzyme M protein